MTVYLETRIQMNLAQPWNYYVFMHVANVYSCFQTGQNYECIESRFNVMTHRSIKIEMS